MSASKLDFSKPAISIEAQVETLRNRGLAISDPEKAAHFVKFVGYYRLSGYYRYYVDPKDPNSEQFYEDATFERVVELYAFDRRLRTLLQDALERIEVALKAGLSNSASVLDDPFWLYKDQHFDRGSHGRIMAEIGQYLEPPGKKQKHIFLDHFYKKYSNEYPPVWMLLEALSFGVVSKIYKHSKGTVRLPIASAFEVQHDILESWLHALAFARNTCAHHSRLWNRTFTIKPKVPRRNYAHWEPHKDKLYVISSIIQHLMKCLADDSGWGERFIELIEARPAVPLTAMGFPEDWRAKAPWT